LYLEWQKRRKWDAAAPAAYAPPASPAARRAAQQRACVDVRKRGARIEQRDLTRGNSFAYWADVPLGDAGVAADPLRLIDMVVAQWATTKSGRERNVAYPSAQMMSTLFTAIDTVVFRGTLRQRCRVRAATPSFRVDDELDVDDDGNWAMRIYTGAGERPVVSANGTVWAGLTDAGARAIQVGVGLRRGRARQDYFVLSMMHEITHLVQLCLFDDTEKDPPSHNDEFFRICRLFFGFRDNIEHDDVVDADAAEAVE
jgi:hypothetical protein